MAKKDKEQNVPAGVDKLQQVKIESAAKQIEVILTENGIGLQPYIDVSNFGIMPRVRLIVMPKEENKDVKEEPKK